MGIENYREHLSETEKKHSPKQLFIEGNKDLLYLKRRVSVVGSRKASKEGLIRAKIVAQALVRQDIIVVSGLAAGIDTIAHQTAIEEGGNTIAVLGTPLDKTYPKQNSELLQKIKREHLAISQFPIGYPSLPKNFPIRNRIISGLSEGVLVIEAALKSQYAIMRSVSLKEALAFARKQASDGDKVLLSPGCTSYDMFRNYIERGKEFKYLVEQL